MAKVSVSVWKKRFSEFFTGQESLNTKNGGLEIKAWCPIHQDHDDRKSACAFFNFEKGVWSCHGQHCERKYPTLEKLWSQVLDDRSDDKHQKASKKKSGKTRKVPLPSSSQLERWHHDLITNPVALNAFMEKRGLSMETIETYGIGYIAQKKRFSIPVFDLQGELVDVRQYRMNSKQADNKMISVAGHGGAHLFLADALHRDEEILLCEGEMDALTAREHGFNSMTHTSGAKAWQDKWSFLFEGKTVFICYDDDDEGRQGANKTALSLRKHNAKVYIVRLNLPTLKRGDLTDYFVKQGNVAQDFRELIEDARVSVVGQPSRTKYPEGDPVQLSVEDSFDPVYARRPIEIIGTVSGKASAPIIVPRRANFTCDQQWGDRCNKCPMQTANGQIDKEIDPRDEVVLSLIDKTDEARDKIMRKIVGAPSTCPRLDITNDSEWAVEELIVIPSVETRGEDVVNPVDRIVYNVGTHDLQVNKTMKFLGTNLPSPRDARSVFQAWEHEEVSVDIDRFKMTPEIRNRLHEVFSVDEEWGETPYDKMREIARDLSLNVTNIYGRYDLHMGYDLVWHSVMDFKFNGQNVGKGWLEMIVLGDTRTGKSEVGQRLCHHYQAGVLVGSEAASFAGLIGGAAQKGTSKTWGITWGLIPLNDRRLVILDEAGGLVGKGIIENMSSVRSSGIAEITKMGGQRTSARTRLVWIANPIDGRTLEEMSRGAIDGLMDMIKNPEDIARFDFAMSAAEDDVPSEVINRSKHEKTEHLHTSEDCQMLVTWAWSRKVEDIIFGRGVEDYIYQQAEELGKRYVSEPPLIQKQNVRVKLARMAVAVACRVFSADPTGEKVLVGTEHVDTALRLLNIFYGSESFGYKDYSSRQIVSRLIAERNYDDCKRFILNNDRVWDTLKQVHLDTSFKHRDFRDFGGMMDEEATNAVSELLGFGMLRRQSKGYLKMEAPLVRMIKEMIIEEEMERLDE